MIKASNFNSRVRIISSAILIFVLLIIVKLYMIQVVSGDEFALRAERQYLNSNYSLFDRGTIYFTNKDGTLVSAATLKSGFTVAINPRLIVGPEEDYAKISKIIPIDKATFLEKAAKAPDPYEEISKRIDGERAQAIENLELAGVNIYHQKWRFYPGGPMAAQTLGIIGYQGDELGGRYGLERFYENTLKRVTGEGYVNFFAEIFSNIKSTFSETAEREGDIVTTIEPSVEAYLERELKMVNEKYSSGYSGGIIMNPKTGEILAMAIDPAFNPNDFQDVKDPSTFSNKLVENVYEMGSIIKPLTIAAGLDTGVINPNSTYNDTGFIWLNKKKISNYDGKARGVIPIQEILSQSLNVGSAHISQLIGKENFTRYFLSYGIGTKTGIDLPNETQGLVNNLTSPREVEYATASFGQGIAMTPIETARALAVLANGGALVTPHLVKEIKYETGLTKTIEYEPGLQVLKKETAEEVTRMLVKVVDTALRGGTVKIANLSVAAKTGTAQISDPNTKKYYEDRFLHSFFGYFPAFEPKFFIFLFTYDPKGVKYASETLTDSFIDLTKFLVNYYEIPPDR